MKIGANFLPLIGNDNFYNEKENVNLTEVMST